MLKLQTLLMVALIGFFCLPAHAATMAEAQQATQGRGAMMPGGGAPSIFAYPGKTCPGGSELYPGPEQDLAAATGAVYCRFFRKVIVIQKTGSAGKCPFGMKEHVEANAKPGDKVMWCEPDPSAKLNIPPPPAQPPKK